MKGKTLVPLLLVVVLVIAGGVSLVARRMVADRKARGIEVGKPAATSGEDAEAAGSTP